jgi:CRP/FNR family transcriptional regulator, cyclic AMP receptor protein
MGVDVEFLRRVSLFRDLSDAEILSLSRMFSERSYDRGQVVFTEEDTGRTMYVVHEGRVKVSRWLASGREVILAFHPAADYFGEMALIDGQTTPATVTAVVPTTILTLGRSHFAELLRQPSFATALLRALCARCRDAWQQIEVLSHQNAEARIRIALHQLCLRKGTRTPEGVRIEVPLTHRELASLAGVSRETATRVLGLLAEAKLVRVEGRRFLVTEPERLIETTLLE